MEISEAQPQREVLRSMKKSIRGLLLMFFTILLVISLWQLWGIFSSYQEGEDCYNELQQYVSFATPPASAETTETESIAVTQRPDTSAWPQVDFEQLSQINPDIVGWIYIEGTDINYPVVQGPDNDYYLRRLFDGTYNRSGCIFLDAGCAFDFSGRHSVIYGHHMMNDSMFSGLMEYKDQNYYDEHSVALLATPTAYYRIQLFSGYVADDWTNAWELSFDDYGYTRWLDDIQSRSCFAAEFAPTKEDKIVTLSTCDYEFDGAKFVLHGYISEAIEKTSP